MHRYRQQRQRSVRKNTQDHGEIKERSRRNKREMMERSKQDQRKINNKKEKTSLSRQCLLIGLKRAASTTLDTTHFALFLLPACASSAVRVQCRRADWAMRTQAGSSAVMEVEAVVAKSVAVQVRYIAVDCRCSLWQCRYWQ